MTIRILSDGTSATPKFIRAAIANGGSYTEDGLTISVTGNKFTLTGSDELTRKYLPQGQEPKAISETGFFVKEVFQIWVLKQIGYDTENVWQPIANYDSLEEAAKAAVEGSPFYRLFVYPKGQDPKQVPAAEYPGGFFIQKSFQ